MREGNEKSYRRPNRPYRRAFTLIEMVMAMIVLTLISSAVFALLQTTVRAVSSVQERQTEESQVAALREMFRKTFGALPSDATLSCELIEGGDPPLQEVTLEGAPNAFSFGLKTTSQEDLVFSLQPQLDDGELDAVPLYVLSMTREDYISDEEEGLVVEEQGRILLAPDEDNRYWFPLIRNIEYLRWGFYNENEEDWDEEWEDDLPRLVQLEIQLAGRSVPTRVVFPVIAAQAQDEG